VNAKRVIRSSVVFAVVIATAAFAALGNTSASHAAARVSCSASNCKVALIISDAGLGDKGFNDLGNAGMKKAIKAFSGVTGTPVQDPQIDTHCTQDLTQAAQGGYGLVINLNYGCGTALEQVAAQYPNTRFVMVDNVAKGANVTSEMFNVQDSSFLAGAAAAMLNLNGKAKQVRGHHTIGAIGGVKSPGIDQFLVGYQQGAKYIDKKAKVLVAYANSFADPSKGAALTKSMFSQGATVVYQVAGVTGLGGIKAAKQKNLFAIGVDSNQDYLAPGHVLTSSIKHTDTAVYTAIAEYVQGQLKGGATINFGLGNKGVAISPMRYTKKLFPASDLKRLAQLTTQIKNGKLHVWNVPTQGYPKWFSGGK
jgi:basic membrane protein A and related proteins